MAGTEVHPSERQLNKKKEQILNKGSQSAEGYFNITKRPKGSKVLEGRHQNGEARNCQAGKQRNEHTQSIQVTSCQNMLWRGWH